MRSPKFKQRCALCRKNMVVMYSARQFPICSACQMKRLEGEIEDTEMRRLFDIPQEFYEQSYFLRNVKEYYLRTGNLSEKQIAAFKKVVVDMKNQKKKEESKQKDDKNAAQAHTPT